MRSRGMWTAAAIGAIGPLRGIKPVLAVACVWALAAAIVLAAGSAIGATPPPVERPALAPIHPVDDTARSHAFSAARYQSHPLDLASYGYTEQEYFVSGEARVFDWDSHGLTVLARGPYTTRILIRRPLDSRRASGTVIVEPMNPSVDIDLPIMWAESYRHFIAAGDVWVGVTIKPNTIKALQAFDATRYAAVSMHNPGVAAACAAGDINPWSQPTTPADETGLAWDILSQVGMLLKSPSSANPLSRPAFRLYMTGQSQTAGYARLYASVFARAEVGPDGRPLYNGYLYSGSPPWQVPINQCWKEPPQGDPRLITTAASVPVIEFFTQGDLETNVPTRRPDSDTFPDLFRRYEVAGAAHVDPWEDLSFASDEDAARAHGRLHDNESEVCSPKDVTPSDFPNRYVFDAAWANLENWVRSGKAPPHARPLELKSGSSRLSPGEGFVVDQHGNAKGGVRTPYVDVPTARWIGAKSGPFVCLFHGYKLPFDATRLRQLYGSHPSYVKLVRASVQSLVAQRWLTPADGEEIVHEAEGADLPLSVAADSQTALPPVTPVLPAAPFVPAVSGPIPVTALSWPWIAANHAAQPINLDHLGYVEEEYAIKGVARVLDWPSIDHLSSLAEGPYTTRILVRRPADPRRFSGTVWVEPLNPSMRYDLPLVWGDTHDYLVSRGDIWVGVTVKPVAIQSLKEFDARRYADLDMPNPLPPRATCPQTALPMPRGGLPPESSPRTENGLMWDILSQLGALLRAPPPASPLHPFHLQRLFMIGDSQSGAFVLTYANAIHPFARTATGGPLYDGYLATVATGPSTPLRQCAQPIPQGDPRRVIQPRGVPIVTVVSETETVSLHRRPDSDRFPDLFRGYEVAGASHVHATDGQDAPSTADAAKTQGARFDTNADCAEKGAPPNDVPIAMIVDGALANLDDWSRGGRSPPHGEPLTIHQQPGGIADVERDGFGNALGGVRTPALDVPIARYHPRMSGPGVCELWGYREPFSTVQLRSLYPTHEAYVAKVRASVADFVAARWFTRRDGDRIITTASAARVP
ncbi:MAG TPA: alpha/beta hydrolase domain-containing protein [Steroidobacteraceae bacterium]